MTVRVWARSSEEAALIIHPHAEPPQLDETVAPIGEWLPFTAETPVVHCVRCATVMAAANYEHPAHDCVPPVDLADEDDIAIEVNTAAMATELRYAVRLAAYDAVAIVLAKTFGVAARATVNVLDARLRYLGADQ
jgi:hypothetical protein